MKISECDFIFISYDEPNADLHYASLCNKIPWTKRVHGVKGSDAAHKVAAELSETEWLVTVDADNLVHENFFDLDIEPTDEIQVYSWLSENKINGLMYGNGGLKLWRRNFIENMRSHEAATTPRAQVDFCWEEGYKQLMTCFSISDITASPFQAWRAGFREGVKMTLCDGIKVPSQEIKERIWWHNLHRLRLWSTVGSHEKNGIFSVLGARQGTYMANCTEWNFLDVRDFEALRSIYIREVEPLENNSDLIIDKIKQLGKQIQLELGLDWIYLDAVQSRYMLELYKETIKLCRSYYRD